MFRTVPKKRGVTQERQKQRVVWSTHPGQDEVADVVPEDAQGDEEHDDGGHHGQEVAHLGEDGLVVVLGRRGKSEYHMHVAGKEGQLSRW